MVASISNKNCFKVSLLVQRIRKDWNIPIDCPRMLLTIPAKSFWTPSEESPPPLPLIQCCYNDVDFSFGFFRTCKTTLGRGNGGIRSYCPIFCLRLSERDMPNVLCRFTPCESRHSCRVTSWNRRFGVDAAPY